MGDELRFPHLIRAILAKPWAIDQDSLAWAAIVEVLALRAAGQLLSLDEIDERLAAAQNGPRGGVGRGARGNVAHIPVYGVISPRTSMMARSSGGTSAESIGASLRAALADPEVDGIVFDVDSPGGVVEGMTELAAEILAARGRKPMAAIANHTAASAAYWPFAGVDEFVATPSGLVGSIGIFTAHDDLSEALAKVGVKRTVISAGKYKAEGALGTPLSEEALAATQEMVDHYFGLMEADIAKGRGVPVETVRTGFGEGRVVPAKKALAAGMIDRVDTLDNTIRRVARGAVGTPPRAAAIDRTPVAGESAQDPLAALGSGQPFAERLALVSAEAERLAEHARTRAELRADEGRDLSDATRTGLRELAASLVAMATEEPAEPLEDPAPAATPQARRRVDLEVFEAAARGGYALRSPDPAGAPSNA